MHVIARARYLIISHIREVKGGAVAMTALRDRIDVSAASQVLDVLLRTQYGSDVEPVVRQVVAP